MPYSPGLKNEHTYIHIHKHTQHKTQYSIAQHTQTYACTKLNKAHIPVCIWHTHGQLSIYTAQTVWLYGTSMANLLYMQHRLPIWHKHVQPSVHAAQTVCLYGTSMSNLLYTQHKLFAYMAQACPTFCTRSTNCLPIWHKHGQPSVHAAQTVCLYGTSMANLPYTQHKLFAS